MKIAVVSVDSQIGEQIAQVHEQRGDSVITSSRNGNGTRHMELTQSRTWFLPDDAERVYYTIGVGSERCSRSETIHINAVLAVDYLGVLASRLRPEAKIVVFSSEYGSISATRAQRAMTYRMSKAALNMGVKCLSLEHARHTWLLLHPGAVQTKIASRTLVNAISERESALGTVATADAHAGPLRFLRYDGTELGW